jgi:hypothetical protein
MELYLAMQIAYVPIAMLDLSDGARLLTGYLICDISEGRGGIPSYRSHRMHGAV